MAEGKNNVVIHADWIDLFEALEDDEAGRLIKHFFRYINDQNPEPPDRLTEISFVPIKRTLKANLKKWNETVESKSKGGRIGNLKRWNLDLYEKHNAGVITLEEAERIASDRIPTKPIASVAKIADTETETDTETDFLLKKETKPIKKNKSKKVSLFSGTF